MTLGRWAMSMTFLTRCPHMIIATSPTAGRRHRPRHGRYFGSYPAISQDWRGLIASMTGSSAPVSLPVAWLAHLTTLLPPLPHRSSPASAAPSADAGEEPA